MNDKNKIQAVFKEELQNLLESIKEIEPINNGERTCTVCLKVIIPDNIQLIIPRAQKQYAYVCNNPVCIGEYNKRGNLS